MSEQKSWDNVSIQVERIANGFLVQERRSAPGEWLSGERLFYPTMDLVERELVIRLRAAQALTPETSIPESDF